nr:MAG TPA: hypothetical protein [Caudoviricetes sp.]
MGQQVTKKTCIFRSISNYCNILLLPVLEKLGEDVRNETICSQSVSVLW